MKRRSFIKNAGMLPLAISGLPLALISGSLLASQSNRVLVLIQLLGGNDGLNMVIPVNQYANLNQVRSNILVPEPSILGLGNGPGSDAGDGLGLHPAMTSLQQVWQDGYLQIIQSVGYPSQNRSHFRSQDIWNTASASDEFITTGWLGRYFENDHASYPFGYPNASFPDPLALVVGTSVAETCQGTLANYSLAVSDPYNPGMVNAGEPGPLPANCYGKELGYVQQVAAQTNGYSAAITNAANLGNNLSTKYHANGFNYVAEALRIIARLVSGGLQTGVYVVRMGGYDTHADQVSQNDKATGTQADLLQLLSDAICAFQEDLVLLGVADRVLGMTYSEFGRRIRSNASLGTDHGSAAPMLLFGSMANAGTVGQNPVIGSQVDVEEGVAMQYDFRDVYGTLFCDWFGVSPDGVRALLHPNFQKLPLISMPQSSHIFSNGFE